MSATSEKGVYEMNSYVKEIVERSLKRYIDEIFYDFLAGKTALNTFIHDEIEREDLYFPLERYLEDNGLFDYYEGDRETFPFSYYRQALGIFRLDIVMDITAYNGLSDLVVEQSPVNDLNEIEQFLLNHDMFLADYVKMTDEEYEQLEREPHNKIDDAVYLYVYQNRSIIKDGVADTFRRVIESNNMVAQLDVKNAPVVDIADLFNELDRECQ